MDINYRRMNIHEEKIMLHDLVEIKVPRVYYIDQHQSQ